MPLAYEVLVGSAGSFLKSDKTFQRTLAKVATLCKTRGVESPPKLTSFLWCRIFMACQSRFSSCLRARVDAEQLMRISGCSRFLIYNCAWQKLAQVQAAELSK